MSRYRSGPPPLLIVLIGAFLVFGGYFVWTGFLSFLEDQGDITAQVTRAAVSSATALAAPPVQISTLYMPPTFTPLPPCQWFIVNVERAVYRECPSQDNRDCPIVEVVPYGTELCIYARARDNAEWFVVELNPGGAYRDTVYIHESVIEAANPTPTITYTFTPRPTISPTPSLDVTPTVPPSPTDTPIPATETPLSTPTGTPSPTSTPSPTPRQITI